MSLFDKFNKEEATENEVLENEETFVDTVEASEEIAVPEGETLTENLDTVTEIPEEPTPAAPAYNDEMGIIAAGTTIHGDVRTGGHLVVAGVVDGNVDCAGNLMLTGEIKGTVECNNIVLESCDCSPCLHVKESVSIKENTRFAGDITCKHISVNGTVIGNINASGNLGITKGAVVEGDITAAVLAIEPGAKIKGYVNTL